MIRLKNLQQKGMKKILSRRIKSHGAGYAISGTVPVLCKTIFTIDANFFALRFVVYSVYSLHFYVLYYSVFIIILFSDFRLPRQ